MIRVGVVGGTGKLGREIIRLLMNHADLSLGAVITRKGNVLVGEDAGCLVDGRKTGIVIQDQILATIDQCDMYIDCTNAEALLAENDRAYSIACKPVVIATTGLINEDMERIEKLSESMPIVVCPNFSIGVYKFLKLVQLAATEFGNYSDIDIFEYHHKTKKDRPSGTAIAMEQTIRSSGVENKIEIHSVRAGTIIGEHTVMFTTSDNERIEISHKAFSRESFSRGVVKTIKWIVGQPNGLYGMNDIFQ